MLSIVLSTHDKVYLLKEVLTLRDYIDKTFEYVSLLFDFSKDRLKRLVNSFIYGLNKEK